MEVNNLGEVIEFNSGFKTAINLYLSLNKTDKVLNYIPTKSSVRFMDEYLEAVLGKKEHATLLVGPYGKGKSHLLLVLLAVLSLSRNEENTRVINKLKNKIKSVEEIGNKTATDIEKIWKSKKFLPVIINDTKGELNQAFLQALSDALRRDGLDNLVPDTYFSEALRRMKDWEKEYPDTFKNFEKAIKKHGFDIVTMRAGLKQYSDETLKIFEDIYPTITAGSSFNPLATSEVLPLYKSVAEKLVEDYGYSGVYIVFDEFSKFIEGLDGTNAGNTMKLLQDMCELAADSSNAQIYLTMVAHKSIKEYGKYLSPEIINAFTGIEGRILEKFFVTSSKNNYELIRSAIVKNKDKLKAIPGIDKILGEENFKDYYNIPAFKSNFSENDFASIILKGCYPLNPIAAYLLLNVSEKVAQNERTLFTFISNDEPHSMARYISEHDQTKGWVIGADLIYDYFSGLFKKEVSNELVHGIWLGAEYAISKCTDSEEIKLIKTLALIQIVNKGDELPANEKYIALAAVLIDGNETLNSLIEKKLIYKKSSIGAYVFKTRAGSELKAELKKQREIRGSNCNYSNSLQQITGKYFVIPRKYNTEKMMTRYFRHEYMDVNTFLSLSDATVLFEPGDAADGKVISLYSFEKFSVSEVKAHFTELKCKKLIVILPKNKLVIEKALRDFEILQGIRCNQKFIDSNEVMKKEIPLLEEDLVKEVEDNVTEIYMAEDTKVLFWSKEKVQARSSAQEESAVNICCEEIYYKTPLINNEIINRANITTSQTKKARLNIIDAILRKEDTSDFYAGTNQEATIYRALFDKAEIKVFECDNGIAEINGLIDEFISSCCDNRTSFSEIISKLTGAPYGMRMGVLPVYLAKVMANRKEDLIVYFSNMEVQVSPEIIVNVCERAEEYSLFVSKADTDKEMYIEKLNTLFEVEDSRTLTENRIKNIVLCMRRWFRALPQVSRNIAGISDYDGSEQLKQKLKAFKKMMQKVDLNPYEILFVNIPEAFGTDDLTSTYEAIAECKKAFESYLTWTIERTISGVYSIWDKRRKLDLYHLLKEWYEKQSNLSKQGLHSGGVTNLMSCIGKLDVYADEDVAQKLVKAVTNVYIENWLDDAYESFVNELESIKYEVEQIKGEKSEGKLLLSFVGSKGEKIEKYYEKADEGTGTVLRNIIEDTLEEYDDISVNDRVAILLEMIEKIIG